MSRHRIYEDRIDIDIRNTIDFYNKRAKKIAEMDCPYTAVLLGDQNPKYAEQWNVFEKEYIFPMIKADASCTVLDIGCGMGRWAESIIPKVAYYLGVDFSCDMIEAAKNRCKFDGKSYDFLNLSFQEVVSRADLFERKFDRLIISGVCMYINDGELSECMRALPTLLQ